MKFVVNAGIEAQFFDCIPAFVRSTGNADCTATSRLGQSAKSTADSPCGSADDQSFAGLWLNDFHQAIPGSDTGHAHRAKVVRQGHVSGVHLAQSSRLANIDHAVVLPTTHAHHLVARLKLWRKAFHHLAHRARAHNLAQRLRRGVAFRVVHAATHVRIKTQKMMSHQHLAFLQLRRFNADNFEVAGSSFSGRSVV